MCGIVGILSQKPVLSELIEALRRVEYRGYDSSGIALIEQGTLKRYRAVGTLQQLEKILPAQVNAHIGIGHTRWATHGAPEERNAHPHLSQNIAVVHNGIIENFSELKTLLLRKGYSFESDTDTEVVAHLIHFWYHETQDIKLVFQRVLQELEGTFALGILVEDYPETIFIARKGTSPLTIGKAPGTISVGSDALSLLGLAQDICYVEDKVWGVLSLKDITLYSSDNTPLSVHFIPNPFSQDHLGRGEFQHYMLKEMYEQPDIVLKESNTALNLPHEIPSAQHITLVGCGSAFYAGWCGKYYLEKLARRAATIELASEFHYRNPVMQEGITIAISQSGETADTLKAIQYAKEQKQYTVGLINVPHSSIARQVDHEILLHAGPEIGVASTKAFTAQILYMLRLALKLCPDHSVIKRIQNDLKHLPLHMQKIFFKASQLQDIAQQLSVAKAIIYLGRGMSYPIALEGALKMSELSYIHAQGFAAGELKHGPLALIDISTPVIVLAPMDDSFEKTVSNIHEVCARGGKVFVITDEKGVEQLRGISVQDIFVYPSAESSELHPFLSALTLQLIAYYTALCNGCAIDQPRNLAKSVTVE